MAEEAPMPSEVQGSLGFFDRFAGRAADMVSRAPFFALCVLVIAFWAPSLAVLSVDTWQLVINTITAIVTFLLVALLQNLERRGDLATQHKLNAIAAGLSVLMRQEADRSNDAELRRGIAELASAVGLEQRETSR